MRDLFPFSEILLHSLRQPHPVPDAVRDRHAGEEVAADPEPREVALDLLGEVDEAAVADLVLGNGPRPATDEAEDRLGAYPERLPDLGEERGGDPVVIPADDLGVGAAASEGGERDLPGRGAV